MTFNRAFLFTAVTLLVAVSLAGCKTTRSPETTGSIGTAPQPVTDWRGEAERWGEAYRKNQKDPEAAVRYAQALRATGQRAQAASVLEQAAIYNPRSRDVLGRAHTPDQPDWRILSAQGAVLDQMGKPQDAQRYYASALKIMPDEPTVLSNLGLSYALSKDLARAEETLRRANAQRGAGPRVRQNLALVVGLQGRFQEAETIARGDLSADEAAANVAYLRQMLAEEQTKKARS